MSSFLNFLVVAILIFDRSLIRLVVPSWLFARSFDLGGAILTSIWSLFHLVVQSWHLELFARSFDLWWCDLDIYLIFIPFGSAILTSWLFARSFDLCSVYWCDLDILTFCPFIWSWWCDLDIYLIFIPFGSAILTSWLFARSFWSLFRLLVRSWHLDFLPVHLILVVRSWHLFDLYSVWWCDLDILNFCPFIIWSWSYIL
jgi:hypothetical protein